MSLRFSRRVSIFPGVHLNFSKSGISTTIGVPGASITLGGRNTATANLGLPGTGLSLRIPLGSGPGRSSFTDEKLKRPQRPSKSQGQKPVSQMTSIASDAIGTITTHGLHGLRDLIISAMEQRADAQAAASRAATLLNDWDHALIDAYQKRDLAQQRYEKLTGSLFRGFRQRAIAATWAEVGRMRKLVEQVSTNMDKARAYKEAAEQRRDELWIDADIGLSGRSRDAWVRLKEAFEELSNSELIWDITAYRNKRAGEERIGATRLVERERIHLSTSELPVLFTKDVALCWQNSNGGDLYFYPGFVIVFKNERDFAILDLDEVKCDFEPSRFEEWDHSPTDTTQVGIAWRYSNRDGSPDRRYADNPQTPVFLYGNIVWTSNSGLSEAYQFSNAKAAARFVDAVTDFRNSRAASSPTGDQFQFESDEALTQILEKIEFLPKNFALIPGTATWTFDCEVRCRKCDGNILCVPDNADDSSLATCKSCGAEIGNFGALQAAGQHVGQMEIRRQGLA